MFLEATDASVETEQLQRVIAKATDVLRSDGTKMAESSFLEAWEEVEITAQEMGSYHSRFIEHRALAIHLSPFSHLVFIFCTISINLV